MRELGNRHPGHLGGLPGPRRHRRVGGQLQEPGQLAVRQHAQQLDDSRAVLLVGVLRFARRLGLVLPPGRLVIARPDALAVLDMPRHDDHRNGAPTC